MALNQIKPEYLSWVQKSGNINNMISNISKEMVNLNNTILNGTSTDKKVQNSIKDIRKKILYTNLFLNQKIIENTNQDFTKQKVLLENLNKNMKDINSYEQNNIIINQKKSIDVLTWFSIFFLPLTFITSYYGMNFKSMGAPSLQTGPFSWKYGQLWVMFLFVFSLIGTVWYINIYYK